MDKREYIRQLAIFLHKNDTKMAVNELAIHLNRNNFKTNSGEEYEGSRGTYTLVHATYDWLISIDKQDDADKVAQSFTKSDGSYAFD